MSSGAGSDVDGDGSSLTLHSTWRGLLASLAGSVLVLGLGLLALAAGGLRVVPIIITGIGVFLLVGVLVDYPIAATFDREGVTRRAILRRHRLEWSSVRQLSRSRPSLLALRKKAVQGGLIAVVGRRRYLLVDVVESAGEHDRLVELLGENALGEDSLGVDWLRRPADDVPPTWLYRRRHHRPDTAR